ncbi:DUF808 domain-containing protein [Psychrobacter sp. NZS113]|uniref:DUF808 domain-containing protein n=1 Tax=Psychrobacter sp. NZS113 TaxID=2792045 RepID=UPI0018CD97F6|nr:DUF808 domain-containing protein [Psychrobacter sp. NZS113]MBH0095169.1 DUF808 domain-containing protein [Psychrobacter sp. NZS113]
MAGASLLLLLDDISLLMDDVSVMTKVAAKKTAGLVGDDLALNAEQVTGVRPSRELPVIWAVAKGSFVNKLILVPAALLISYFIPWLITPLLMIGGLYLSFEGAEKVIHKFWPKLLPHDEVHEARRAANADDNVDMVAFEKDKIKGAIRTDFILSAEILVISLGAITAAGAGILEKGIVLSIVAIVVTIGIYGLVAGIVKIDDAGLHLIEKPDASDGTRKLGQFMLSAAPKLMKFLSIAGTIAMFLVGGGIIAHGIAPLEHFLEGIVHQIGVLEGLVTMLLHGILGFVVGAIVLFIITVINNVRGGKESTAH